jgi:hypothetical protein
MENVLDPKRGPDGGSTSQESPEIFNPVLHSSFFSRRFILPRINARFRHMRLYSCDGKKEASQLILIPDMAIQESKGPMQGAIIIVKIPQGRYVITQDS